MRLDGKVALVTGGGSGIGREICLAFAREGAHVAVNDIKPASITETITAMGEAGARALAVPADVGDSGKVAEMFAAVARRYPTLDVLVNNAGIGEVPGRGEGERLNRLAEARIGEMMGGGPVRTRWNITQTLDDATWDAMLRTHLYGTFYCSREALKIMEAKGSGRIVNMASIAATMGLEGAPHYSAAKAGILGFTRSLAREVGSSGITVNAIAPGFIETSMTDALSPLMRQLWIMNTPLQKSGQPADIAMAAVISRATRPAS